MVAARLEGVGKLLVANRGEIACRVFKTARRLGIPTVAVYSRADQDAKHVKYADEAFCIGDAAAKDSYLRSDRILDVALGNGITHIHPGYGFLSENAAFSQACSDHKISFVGPPASAIRAMGDKIESKVIMERAGVPCVPGYHGDDQSEAALLHESRKIGFPVLVKAALGGGGKGMKIAMREDECKTAVQSAQREALAAFGDQRVLLEKYVQQPRHIEVQVFCDTHGNAVHLFERDCSVQRRHQKIIEEAPAFGISAEFRESLHSAAIDAARAVGYVNAGTVEFLVDARTWDFYFMEMNTRLQVEHPVSEAVSGTDLVEWQLRVSAGEELPLRQEEVPCRGHAVEVRLYAENPERDFLPATGKLHRWRIPPAAEFQVTGGVRVDSGVSEGDSITDFYDPMIAKVVTTGQDRHTAIADMHNALGELQVAGVPTNAPFVRSLLAHPSFLDGADVETNFIEKHERDLFPSTVNPFAGGGAERCLLAAVCHCVSEAGASKPAGSPWDLNDGYRPNMTFVRQLELLTEPGRNHEAEKIAVRISYLEAGAFGVELSSERQGESVVSHVESVNVQGTEFTMEVGGRLKTGSVCSYVNAQGARKLHLWCGGESMQLTVLGRDNVGGHAAEVDAADGALLSPMPGRVVRVHVEDGQRVSAGDPVLVVEAMKMEHVIKAPHEGIVQGMGLHVESKVHEGEVLATIAPHQEK